MSPSSVQPEPRQPSGLPDCSLLAVQDFPHLSGGFIDIAARVDFHPVHLAEVVAKLGIDNVSVCVRGIVPARGDPGFQDVCRRSQPQAAETAFNIIRDGLDTVPFTFGGKNRIEDCRVTCCEDGLNGVVQRVVDLLGRLQRIGFRGAFSVSSMPSRRFRITSVRSTRAPGARPMPGEIS